MRPLLVISLCLPLATTGCFVGDGIAHVVKLAAKSGDSADGSAPPPPAPEAVTAPVERDPAPQPAAAPRDKIQVEQLPPKL